MPDAGTFPCTALVETFETTAKITTTVGCPAGSVVSISTKVFDGDILVDSMRQTDVACGVPAKVEYSETQLITRASAEFAMSSGESGVCAQRVPAIR
jgi:hypothetical protein